MLLFIINVIAQIYTPGSGPIILTGIVSDFPCHLGSLRYCINCAPGFCGIANDV